MNQKQHQFIQKRKRLIEAWQWVGPLCLLSIFILSIWLYQTTPLLINPWEIISRLENDTIESSALSLMALMLPIIVLACFGLLIAIIIFVYAVMSNEKKYQQIINQLTRRS